MIHASSRMEDVDFDDDDVRSLVRSLAARYGYRCILTAQADAIDRLLETVPHLIGLIEERHTAEHSCPMLLCADPLCDAVSLR